MSKMTAKANPEGAQSRTRIVKKNIKGGFVKVTLGDVSVVVAKPSDEQVRRNVRSGVEALERVSKTSKKGVRIYARKGVPLYSADPDEPGVYIRKLNGKVERGVLKDGTFQVKG